MRVDWSNIQVSAKELIAVIVFVFSISGIYYKLFYTSDMQQKQFTAYISITDVRIKAIEENQKTQTKIFEAQIQQLIDDYKARKVIEDYKKTELIPLKKQ